MFILEEFLVVVRITPGMVLETVILNLGCFFSLFRKCYGQIFHNFSVSLCGTQILGSNLQSLVYKSGKSFCSVSNVKPLMVYCQIKCQNKVLPTLLYGQEMHTPLLLQHVKKIMLTVVVLKKKSLQMQHKMFFSGVSVALCCQSEFLILRN